MLARALPLFLLLLAGCGRVADGGTADLGGSPDLPLVVADLSLSMTCGDLGTDVRCGACGRACEVIAGGQANPEAIAVDSNIVYWRTAGNAQAAMPPGPGFDTDGAVFSSPVDGSQAPTTLRSKLVDVNDQPPYALAVFGGHIYFTQGDVATFSSGIYVCPITGCGTATLLAPDPGPIGGIAVDASGIYWTLFSPISIRVGDVASATDKTWWAPTDPTAPSNGVGSGIAIDATDVYWTNGIGQILTCPKSGCGSSGPTLVAEGNSFKSVVVLDAAHVYWTNANGDGFGKIYQCPKSGCGTTPTLLADGRDGPYALAVDDHDVYWSEYFSGTLWRCAVGGCAGQPTLLAAQLRLPTAIALDDSHVYWTEAGLYSYGTNLEPGTVKRMAK